MNDLDTKVGRIFNIATGAWIFAVTISLTLWAVIILAIIKIVNHYT